MSILNIFRREKNIQKTATVCRASATCYPDKILVETIDSTKDGIGISSTNISILTIDIDHEALGASVRNHLSSSRNGLAIPKDHQIFYREFLLKAGFKTGREHHKDALYLSLTQTSNHIILNPTVNGGFTGKDRGFSYLKGAEITLPATIDNSTLGKAIRQGWARCK